MISSFIDASSHQINFARDVEIESVARSASTSRANTPMQTEGDEESDDESEDDVMITSDGQFSVLSSPAPALKWRQKINICLSTIICQILRAGIQRLLQNYS